MELFQYRCYRYRPCHRRERPSPPHYPNCPSKFAHRRRKLHRVFNNSNFAYNMPTAFLTSIPMRANERTGSAKDILQHDYGITTEISTDMSGMSGAQRGKWGRLKHIDNRGRIRNSTERNLATALTELKRIASRMSLPKITAKEAAFIYRKAVDKKLIRGRSIEGVVAASIYAACRMHNNPRTLDDVGRHSRTGRKEIGRTFRFLKRQLVLTIGLSNPTDYIPRFCSELKVHKEIELEAQRILASVGSEAMISRGPTGIAAAAIYLAAKRQKKESCQGRILI